MSDLSTTMSAPVTIISSYRLCYICNSFKLPLYGYYLCRHHFYFLGANSFPHYRKPPERSEGKMFPAVGNELLYGFKFS